MTTAIVGRTGSGKTNAAKSRVTAALVAGQRVCIIDPTDAWWGLRLKRDGVAPSGINVWIFGGDHADVPIREDHGARLGALVASGEAPQSIISLGDFTGGQTTRFMTDFLEALYKANRSALELVVDEADAIAPQSPMPDQRRMSGALDKIVRRGRIKGFRPTLITQRPSVLSKDVLSQASTLIAMRLTLPHDRKAIEDWIRGNANAEDAKLVLSSLAGLKVGEGWEWSPAEDVLERRQFPLTETYDSSRAPEHDEAVCDVKPLASAEIAKLREIFSPSNEEAKIIERPVAVSAQALREAEERGHRSGYALGLHSKAEALRRIMALCEEELAKLDRYEEKLNTPDLSSSNGRTPDFGSGNGGSNPPERTTPPRKATGASGMSPTTRRILDEIQRAYPMGLTYSQAAARAGVSKRSSQYRLYEKQVNESGEVSLRPDGRFVANAGFRDPIGAAGDPVEAFAARLSPSFASMLRVIAAAPKPLNRDEVAKKAGVSPLSSGLAAGLKELRALGLVTLNDRLFSLNPDLRR